MVAEIEGWVVSFWASNISIDDCILRFICPSGECCQKLVYTASVGRFGVRLSAIWSLKIRDFLLFLMNDHVFYGLFLWFEYGLHLLHSGCFLCSFFYVPSDLFRESYHHTLKVEVICKAFCLSNKMIYLYFFRHLLQLQLSFFH